jgi:hypothetical protein
MSTPIDDFARIAAKINNEAKLYFSGEGGARKFLADLLVDIDATLSPEIATPTNDDRYRLTGARVQIPLAFEEIAKIIDSLPAGSPNIRTAYICLHQLMLGAFHAGAFCVVSDSARGYLRKPLSEGGSKGGLQSGKVRRESREWVSHAEEIAKKYVAKNPEKSQDDIATEISHGWKVAEVGAPGHDTLKKHVATMIKEGRLPRRVTKRLRSAK